MAKGNGTNPPHGIGQYIVVAIILGIVTYLEFAMVEYEIPWLSDSATLWWLIILSVAKFALVILFFMHLKDDESAYSGFFGSGMVIGLGTYVAFVFLMTAPSSLAFVRSQLAPNATAEHGAATQDHGAGELVPAATLASIESDGYSRALIARLDAAPPKNHAWSVRPPTAPTSGWTLTAGAVSERVEAAFTTGAGDTTAEPEGEAVDAAPADVSASAEPKSWDQALGEATYAANCASCHQPGGTGIPGAFPPLAGHAAELVGIDGGRSYLIDVLLYGLQGPVAVSGSSYNGVMPAWAFLSDDQLAAVANHLLHAWEDGAALGEGFAPIQPDEVAAERDKGLSGADVHDLRSALVLP